MLPLGLQLLGGNYMDAYNFYWNMGETYFGMASKNKGILPAAKAAYVIAAENLMAVSLKFIISVDQPSGEGRRGEGGQQQEAGGYY